MIDDDESCHVYHQIMIEQTGIDIAVSNFSNAREALGTLQRAILDDPSEALAHFILLDINMPEMDGFEFLEEFHTLEFGEFIPKIYMVSHSEGSEEKKKALGFKHVLGFERKFLSADFFVQLFK